MQLATDLDVARRFCAGTPGLEVLLEDGIADIGFALAAWFTDPHQNSIGLLQFK
jgi:hypothetical protein